MECSTKENCKDKVSINAYIPDLAIEINRQSIYLTKENIISYQQPVLTQTKTWIIVDINKMNKRTSKF